MTKTFNPKKKPIPKPDHETESIRVWIEDADNPTFVKEEDIDKKNNITYKGLEFQMLDFNTVNITHKGKEMRVFYFKLRTDKGHAMYFIDEEKIDTLPEKEQKEVREGVNKLLTDFKELAKKIHFPIYDMKDSLEVTLSELPTLENLSKQKGLNKKSLTKKESERKK